MAKEFWSIREAVEVFQVDDGFLAALEEEEILCPTCTADSTQKQLSSEEMEKLRLAKVLVEEMGVNLSGVSIILRMKQSMIEMRSQFDDILEDLARQLHAMLGSAGPDRN